MSHLRTLPLVLILLLIALRVPAITVGGNPSALLYYPAPGEDLSEPTLAIDSSGSIFVCFAREIATFDYEVVLLRSDDGGDHFFEWDVVTPPAGESYADPQIRIGLGPFFERIFLAYERDGAVDAIEVAFADVTDVTPTWTTFNAIDFTRVSGAFPRLVRYAFDVRADSPTPTDVAVAAVVEVDFDHFEWRYNVSTNGGDGYAGETTVYSQLIVPSEGFWEVDVAVALGSNDEAHYAVVRGIRNGDSSDFGEVRYYNDASNGIAGFTTPAQIIFDEAYALREASMGADQVGDGIVFAAKDAVAGSLVEFPCIVSTDAGGTWSDVVLPDYESMSHPRLASTTLGPRLAADHSLDGFCVWRPQLGPITGPWSRGIWMPVDWQTIDAPCLAEDPTRPGEFAMVGLLQFNTDQERSIRFEAHWRDESGYGLSKEDRPQGSLPFTSAPALADVDGDGDGEIVITSGEGPFHYLEVYQPTAAEGVRRFAELRDSARCSAPVLYDLEGDGDLEIFVGSPNGGVEAFDDELNPLSQWPVAFSEPGDTWLSAGPITGYANGEVVATNADKVHVLNIFGGEMPGWPWVSATGQAVGRAAIGDVDNDSSTEIVAAFTDGVAVLNADGTLQNFFAGPHVPSAGVTLVDLDGDGDLEIAGPMTDGFVLLVHHDGGAYNAGWPFDSASSLPVSSVTVANLIDATTPALCFATATAVYAVDVYGNIMSGYPKALPGLPSTEPILARVARGGTSRPQLITGTQNGWVQLTTAMAEIPRDWPHFYDIESVLPPAVADLDQDGSNDLVIPVNDYLWVLDSGTSSLGAARRWPMSGHDEARTGCADCQQATPTGVEALLPRQSMLAFAGASPNPSGGRTTLSFALSAAGHVELSLFDARGRRVRQLLSGPQPAGEHAIAWDACDERGLEVAAGSYHARLELSQGSIKRVKVQKLMLAR